MESWVVFNDRYYGIVNNMDQYTFHILGCGAIGSSAAQQLIRMSGLNFVLYDMDKVEDANIGVSQYDFRHIGIMKAVALMNTMMEINNQAQIECKVGLFKELYPYGNDIVILGFDSMKSRIKAVETVLKSSNNSILCLIDGRMGAETYQQYNFPHPTIDRYTKTWYPDEQGSEEPCNAKATSYCSNMSGSFIVNAIRKFVTKQPMEKEILFHFPTMMLDSK